MPPDYPRSFGEAVRAMLGEHTMSVRELARRINFDHGYLHRVISGKQAPSDHMRRRIDDVLDADGALTELDDRVQSGSDETGDMLEIMRRVENSDLGPATLDVLHGAVHQLCRDYPSMPGLQLRHRSKKLMGQALDMLNRRTTLAQHRDLLVALGWLSALLGCVHYDVGDRAAAKAARRTTYQLGIQSGHGEITGWSYEMTAWFGLTEGRYDDVIAASQAGRQQAGVSSAGVQLVLQEAKAWARMGDERAHDAITTGWEMLRQLPIPEHPEHHFVFDPSKYEFYAATIYTLLGWNAVAQEHCDEVLHQCIQPSRTQWPMRLADTRIDLGMLARRNGALDEAVHQGQSAFGFERRSGSLFSRSRDLLAELQSRYPGEPLVVELHERVSEEARQ